jgi:tetratricopeptide (TPR) repeat protein
MDNAIVVQQAQVAAIPSNAVTHESRALLLRMFADPHVLEPSQRTSLIAQLRATVAEYPDVAELRVLLAMSLCVNLEVHDAIEELNSAVRIAPDNFLARLKMGELWMRLRVLSKAEEHTERAAQLARNIAQAELARRQRAKIREIRHNGIERGGYQSPLAIWGKLRRLFGSRRGEPVAISEPAVSEAS